MFSGPPLLLRSGMGARPCSQSALVCLTSYHRGDGIRSMLAQSATAKRLGVDGMAALRFHIRKQTRPCRFCPQQEDELRQPQQTSSNWPIGRHDTGSAIQRLMSDSRQPAPLTLILIWAGNVPSVILR